MQQNSGDFWEVLYLCNNFNMLKRRGGVGNVHVKNVIASAHGSTRALKCLQICNKCEPTQSMSQQNWPHSYATIFFFTPGHDNWPNASECPSPKRSRVDGWMCGRASSFSTLCPGHWDARNHLNSEHCCETWNTAVRVSMGGGMGRGEERKGKERGGRRSGHPHTAVVLPDLHPPQALPGETTQKERREEEGGERGVKEAASNTDTKPALGKIAWIMFLTRMLSCQWAALKSRNLTV